MDFVSGVVVYLLLWWWVFLMSLPFGVRIEDNPEAGHATSCLLYTSPSPRDISGSRMPSSA